MTKQTKRLGRGMDALVSDLRHVVTTPQPGGTTSRETDLPPAERADHPEHATPTLPVDRLDPNPFQPRFAADPRGIASLAESIRRSGVLQPIAVRAAGARYQIIAGQRRWEAARHAGLRDVPVVIRDATEEEMLELALIENIQREDLNPLETAQAFRDLIRKFKLTQAEAADRVGKPRSTVA
ncbi:MAG: ParB/RepB/Spo0J family partition protein, partial [Phycisphaerae bacterium]